MGPQGLQRGFGGIHGLAQGGQNQVHLVAVARHQFGHQLGLTLEVVIEMTCADPHSRGDIYGRQTAHALGIEQVQGGRQNSIAGFHMGLAPIDSRLIAFTIGHTCRDRRQGPGPQGRTI